MNLVTLLERRVQEHPERPALCDVVAGRTRVCHYGELWQRVQARAAFLQTLGFGRDSTVLLLHPVRIELYEALLAAFALGVRVMLADPSSGAKFMGLCCQRGNPEGFFGSPKAHLLRLKVPALRKIPHQLHDAGWLPFSRRWRNEGSEPGVVDVADDHPALVTFTSGSTGVPKAAVRSHGFLLAQHSALARSLQLEEGEVDLITLPVFVLANLASGLTSVLADTDLAKPGNANAPAVFRQCVRHGVTRCAASPAFFEALLRDPSELPAFGKIYSGGAPVFPDLLEKLCQRLPQAQVVSVYGSTEAEPMAECDAEETQRHLDRTKSGDGLLAGLPVDEADIRILQDHSGEPLGPFAEEDLSRLLTDPGEPGEIVVHGAHVLRGYLDGVGDSETKIHVGNDVWHRTGDAGVFDSEGRLWLLGRCAARLHRMGEPACYPLMIEGAVRCLLPGRRCAALRQDEDILLCLEGEDDARIVEQLRPVMERWSSLRLRFLPELPVDRRHNAKIDYPLLQELLATRDT